ncbi:MAG: hypothetical protein QGF46_04175 [Planctomycetota bacterium]|jgi:hypothetical protein|nr:hypothetical protein [Planctomycetota bacterium]
MVDPRQNSEYAEIPSEVKEQVEKNVRREIFDLLHLEAVQRGDIPAAPTTKFDQLAGRTAKLVFNIGLGTFIGTLATFVCVVVIRKLTTVI